MRSKNKLLAAIGVPLLTLLLILAASLPLAAQTSEPPITQLPNVGFTKWKTTCGSTDAYGSDMQLSQNQRPGSEPESWNGSSVNQTVSGVTKTETLITKATDGTYAILENKYVGITLGFLKIGSIAPGYLTLGTPWVYAVKNTSNCDGGTHGGINFTSRPDAVSAKVKRSDSNSEDSHIIFYSWKETFSSKIPKVNKKIDQDNLDRVILGRESATISGTLVAKVDYSFATTKDKGWDIVVAPIEYCSSENPEMMNVIISAGEYWDRSALKEGTTLDVTDVKLIYYSRLASVTIGSEDPISFEEMPTSAFVDGVLEYEYNGYLNGVALKDIDCTPMGNSGSSTITKKYIENNCLTIVVTNNQVGAEAADEDGLKTHTYKIYGKRCSRLASVTIGEGESASVIAINDKVNTYDYQGYLNDIDVDKVYPKLVNDDNTTTIGIEPDSEHNRIVITVTGSDADIDDQQEHIYYINCKVCSRLKSIEINGHEYVFNNPKYDENGVATYDYPGYLKDIHLDEIEATYTLINGDEATSVVVDKNIPENQLEITVKGNDNCGHAEHKYIIHCAAYIPLTSIKFDQESYELTVGSEMTLSADNLTFEPADASETDFNFTWNDQYDYADEALNHDDGSLKLTGKKAGTFTVTATSEAYPNVKATVNVTVVPKVIRPVGINDVELAKYIYIGETQSFTIPITYTRAEGEEDEAVNVAITKEWVSSNTDVLTVADGKILLTDNIDEREEVTVTFKATFDGADGISQTLSKEWKFTVLQPINTLEWVDENGDEVDYVTIIQGEDEIFKVVFTPENAIDTDIQYEVKPETEGGEKIISYDQETGMITTIGTGTNSIIAMVNNYSDEDASRTPHVAELVVNVVKADDPIVYPKDIIGSFPSSILYVGKTSPFNITTKYVAEKPDETVTAEISTKWESLNPKILTVLNNRVTMVPSITEPENATIRLTATYKDADGKNQTIVKEWEFEVRQAVESIEWQNEAGNAVTELNIKDNERPVIAAVVNPAYTTDKTFKIEVEGPIKYEDGKIIPTGAGTATLTASVENYSKEDTNREPIVSKLTVNVEGLIRPVDVTESEALPKALYIGQTQPFDIKLNYIPDAEGKTVNVKLTEVWQSGNTDVLTVANGKVTMRQNAVMPEGGKTTVKLKSTFTLIDGTTKTLEKIWEFVVRRPVTSVQWQDKNGNAITTVNIEESKTANLKAAIRPATATDQEIQYEVVAETGKEPIITYKDGVLTAVGQGTNTIIARSLNFSEEDESRKPVEAILTVNVVAPKPVTIRPKDITLAEGAVVPEIIYMGETEKFRIPIAYIAETEGQTVNAEITESWSSSNANIVKVSRGELTIGKALTAAADKVTVKVKASFKDAEGKTKSIEREWKFTVRQPVTDIEWRDENGKAVKSLNLAEDATMNLAAVIKPETATDKELTFEVRAGKEKAKVIEYENGVIRAVGRGSVELVAIADNFSADGREKIEFKLPVEVSAMTRSVAITEVGGNEEFYVGKTYKFEAEITPAYDEQVELTWTSSDPDVATIAADGTLTALTAGTTTITVADPDGNKASYMVEVQGFPAISTEIPGYLTVTAPDGTSTTIATSLGLTTTSWTTLDLTLDNVSVNGFPLGNVGMEGVEYSTTGTVDAGSAFIQLLTSQTDTRLELDGGMTVGVAISAGTESFVDLTDRPEIAEVHFDLSFIRQGLDLTAVFSTKMPADFEDPGKPEAGTTVDYNGSITLNVVATRSRAQETETFTVDATLKVTYLTEPDADGWFTADIEVPALHFGAIDEESVAPGEEPDYRYNLESFVLDNVAALRKGNVITYSFDETEVATEDDGYYLASIAGKAKDDGSAVFTLSVNDNNGTIVNGSFNNDGPEGELYKGYLNIEMAGSELADNMPASVIIIPNEDDETVTFLLPNLTLEGIGNLGDIRVENVSVTTDPNGTKTYDGYVEKMQLLGGGIEAEVKIAGTIDADGYADMTINVTWMNIPINVKFTGEHSGTTTGIEAPEATDDAAIDGPVEYYTIGGIRVADGQHLAPGFYIERRGNKARKILVR